MVLLIPILRRQHHLGCNLSWMIYFIPAMYPKSHLHVWKAQIIIKGHHRKLLGRRWIPKTTFPTLLSSFCRLNGRTIITFTGYLLPISFPVDVGSTMTSVCPHRTRRDNPVQTCSTQLQADDLRPFPSFPFVIYFLFTIPLFLFSGYRPATGRY